MINYYQRGNPVIKFIKNAKFEFDPQLVPDYHFGSTGCALFLRWGQYITFSNIYFRSHYSVWHDPVYVTTCWTATMFCDALKTFPPNIVCACCCVSSTPMKTLCLSDNSIRSASLPIWRWLQLGGTISIIFYIHLNCPIQ